MPPKTQFSREQILEAAFEISVENGISTLTVRKIAASLGCSVASIYVNFKNTDQLTNAVMDRIRSKLRLYSTKTYTDIGFFNIGIGQIMFVRDYPRLFLDLLNYDHHCLEVPEDGEEWMLDIMEKDAMLEGLDRIQLIDLLRKMAVFTNGLSIMMTKKHKAFPFDSALRLIEETAHQLVFSLRNGFSDDFTPYSDINLK